MDGLLDCWMNGLMHWWPSHSSSNPSIQLSIYPVTHSSSVPLAIMKLNFENERVLAVVAHPDDAELLCAGTLARAKADGAAIASCVMCRGDKGQPVKAVANLAEVR